MIPSRETANKASFASSHTASNRERTSASGPLPLRFWVPAATSFCSAPAPFISCLELSKRLAFRGVDGEEAIEVQQGHDRVHRRGESDQAHRSGLLLKLLHQHEEGPDAAGSHERDLSQVQDEILAIRLYFRDPLEEDRCGLDVQAALQAQHRGPAPVLNLRDLQVVAHRSPPSLSIIGNLPTKLNSDKGVTPFLSQCPTPFPASSL